MIRVGEEPLELEEGPKSGRLKDFSTQLAQRLRAAPGRTAEPARLAVRLADTGYLLDLASSGEIVAIPEIAPVPWTKPWFRGLSNVRGRLLGVVDLMHLSGRPPMTQEQSLQLVVLGEALKVNAAIIVTRAFGLRNLKDLQPLGDVSDPLRPWERERFRETDGTTLIELDLRRLVATEQFVSIGI
ncbi:MAG TPA: chemotaxis protein CheW [Burkholderiaceae bacterium]|jgi:twitching motility protein PilI|nr:chemotaxis protein CheW [Burkholderiaceae bacterium]